MSRYTVTAERGAGSVWVFQCVEHPGAISESKRLDAAEALMREAIAWVADVAESKVSIEVVPRVDPETLTLLERARTDRVEAEALAAKASSEIRAAAQQLRADGLTVRDIGTVLDVSYQRAHQLVG